MGSSSKKSKEESRKRRHHDNDYEAPREKKHKHKKHHKEKRREKLKYYEEYQRSSRSSHDVVDKKKYDHKSDDSDVVEVILDDSSPKHSYSPPSKSTEKTQEQYSEPEQTSQNVESLSIAETNKLRAKLGLKPLEVGSSRSSSDSGSKRKENEKIKDDWGEFYHKPAENLLDKAQQEKIKAKIADLKEKRALSSKLGKVRTLGESDDEGNDLEAWVKKNRKIEQAKKEAERRAKELEELDAQFGINDIFETDKREKMKEKYTTKDLRGLTVQHDIDSFADERDVILTLKDKGILDEDDDDVLVNVNMVDDERYKKSLENKKKKVLYNAYEDNEFDEFGNPKEKSLLSKYDEEIDGAKKESFKIGFDNATERRQATIESVKAKLAKKRLESIAEKQLTLASEYYNEEELAKFKKPKKKVRKIRSKGKLLTSDELKPDNFGIEKIGSRRPKVKNETDYDIDDVPSVDIETDLKLEDDKDDILEKALHKTRKIKQKENLIADIIKTEIKEETDDVLDNGNIVLNATAEFCRTLGDIPTYGKSGNREDTEEMVDFEKEVVPEEENSDDDCEIIETTGWNTVDPTNHGIDSTQIKPQDLQILDEEPDVSTGVGAALKLAMSKGYLDKEESNRPSNSKLAHLQAQHYSIEDKSYGEEGERGNRRERYAGPITTFKEKDNFKPNVKLEYIDDEGHILNSKEAFRYLSHKFHGKGPGKNKVEKRIKKSIQEQLMKKMSSTDTPLGTLNMLQAKQKETQSPFIVLSGNKQGQSTSLSKTRR